VRDHSVAASAAHSRDTRTDAPDFAVRDLVQAAQIISHMEAAE